MRRLRSSLSIRLSAWIVLCATIIFLATFSIVFTYARETVREEALSRATEMLDESVLRMTGIMERVETASDMATRVVERNLEAPDSMFAYSKAMLTNNPDFYSHSIAFEPMYYKKYGRYLSAYSRRAGDTVRVSQGGSDAYQYFYTDWYLLPKLLGRGNWVDPYMDVDAQTGSKAMVASYSQPIRDEYGKVIGAVNTSISLDWLTRIIQERRPYPNSYIIMTGRNGAFFVHHDLTKLTNQGIFTGTILHPDTARTALGRSMQKGEEGIKRLQQDGKDYCVMYKPIGRSGWNAAIVCPESDIFAAYHRLRNEVAGLVIAGLIAMLVFFIHIITRELKPLQLLSREAEAIASGRFDTIMPDLRRSDEIGQLSRSLGEMQGSLAAHINELRQTTATQAAIDNELRVARSIQMSMLPRVFPPFPERKEIDLYATMTPAKEVGGDMYNFLLREECLYFAIGDVPSKGVPASLFMAQATRLFRTLAGEAFTPEDIATRMNNELCQGNDTLMFATMFIGVIHLKTGLLEYCNCGHLPPVIDGKLMTLKYKNSPIGMMEGVEYHGESVADIRRRLVVVYTDGVTEMMNQDRERFGGERLTKLLGDSSRSTACQAVERLREGVERHRGGAEPDDDLTIMALRIEKLKD